VGNFAGWDVTGFLRGRMGGEPGLLVFDEARGFFADVVDGLEGKFAGEIVFRVLGRLFDVGGPAFGGIDELGEDFAEVLMLRAVVVEVVVEFVGDGGELVEEVVGVLFAAGFAGVGEEVLNPLIARVEELDEDEDAIAGVVGGFAELLDFALGHGVVVALLSVKGQGEGEENESEGEPTEH